MKSEVLRAQESSFSRTCQSPTYALDHGEKYVSFSWKFNFDFHSY